MKTRAQPLRRDGRLAENGFTLLELLLAIAIGSIVLLVINATFFSALRLHNTTHEKIEIDLVLQRTLGILRKDLAGVMLPPNPQATTASLSGQLANDNFSSITTDSTGERITPDLYTSSGTIDGWTPFSEAQSVAYFLTPAADGGPTKNLVRVVTRNLLAVSEPTYDEQILLPGVRSAAIEYYDGIDWTETWDSSATSTLPSAIKFRLVLAPRDELTTRVDPAPVELIVPVLVTTLTSAQAAAASSTP